MAVLPTFDPGQAPDTLGKLNLQAQSDQQSWMDQAQQRAQRQQQMDQQKQQFQAALPALVAKGQADQLASAAAIASATIQQNFRGQAATQMPQATQDFTDALKIPDFDMKANAMSALQAKYGWLGQTPETKPLAEAIDNARVNAHQEAIAHMQMQRQLDQTRAIVEGRTTTANIAAGAKEQVADTAAGARTGAAQIGADARTSAAATGAGAQQSAAVIRAYTEEADALESAAAKEFDPTLKQTLSQKAQVYRDKVDTLSRAAAPAAAAAPAKSTVVAPTAAAPSAPIKVKSWDEAKALQSGTHYVNPDNPNEILIRGKS